MIGCVQWNPVTVEKISPRAGLELGTVRSLATELSRLPEDYNVAIKQYFMTEEGSSRTPKELHRRRKRGGCQGGPAPPL